MYIFKLIGGIFFVLKKNPTQNRADYIRILRKYFKENCSGLTSCGEAIVERAVEDVLVDCNLLKSTDSNIVKSTDGSRVYVDEAFPRTEIEIERIEYKKKDKNR